MYVNIESSKGKVGDIQKHNGLTYEKTRNGKWLLVRNNKLKKLLKDLHIKQGKTIRTITEETGIPHSTVQKALNDFGLMQSKKAKAEDLAKFVKKNLKLLTRMYCELEMTPAEIRKAIHKETGKDFKNIKTEMRRQGVPIRSHGEAIAVATKKGRRYKTTSADALFSPVQITAWDNNLDRSLQGLTFKQYKRIVHRFTYMVVKRFPMYVEPGSRRELRSGTNIELDHQFSKSSGFYEFNGTEYVPRKQPISLEVICHPLNLKLMTSRSNSIKGSGNHIELDELEKQIAKFEKQHGDIFEDYYGTYTKEEIKRYSGI